MKKFGISETPQDTYVFTDWSSISQIINSKDSRLKASARAVICPTGVIDSYEIVIYSEDPYSSVKQTLYQVKVDSSTSWSLSSDQAVRMLNSLGFICKKEDSTYEVSDSVIKILQALQVEGYTHIMRTFSGGLGHVVAILSEVKVKSINEFPDFHYRDWEFLKYDTPESISGLLGKES